MTPHEHTLLRVGAEIRCTAWPICQLAVPRPAGMPDYSRAANTPEQDAAALERFRQWHAPQTIGRSSAVWCIPCDETWPCDHARYLWPLPPRSDD